MVGRILLALAMVVSMAAAAASAQINPSLTEAERGIRRDDAEKDPHLRIDAMRIDAHVVGRTASITLEMQISSDQTTPYEGKLSLLMPADAVVTGYALDVGGKMIPGQLLEAPKARNLYEDEVRAGIDPGLAEVSGNRFATRIYPIDNEHPRRFRVTFAVPFDPAGKIVLPLARDLPIARVDLSVRVDGYADAPAIRFAGQTVKLSKSGAGWTGDAGLKASALRDGMSIEAGALSSPIAVAEHASGDRFFAIADGAGGAAPAARDGRLRIYWDRSRSHRDEDVAAETEALVRLVDAQRPTAIDLVTFASDRPQVQSLRTAAELRAALDKVVYRGATSLAGLDGLALTAASSCVLVSDGDITIDKGAAFAPNCALSVLTGAPGANGARLGRIAQQSGGVVVRVSPATVAQAATALNGRNTTVTAVRDDAGRPVDYRALPAASGQWMLVGRLPQSGAVRVELSNGEQRTYRGNDAAVRADGPAALWAVQGVAALADDPSRHTAMAELARRYQIAGPGMSFLVLERPDQYLRADLTPPTGFSVEWMREYAEAKAERDKDQKEAKADRLAFVLEQWAERREWWRTRFNPMSRAQVRKRSGGEDERGEMEEPPPPPPPPPPPMTSSAPPAQPMQPPPAASSTADTVASEADVGEIVVSGSRRPDLPPTEQPPSTLIKLDLEDVLAKRPYLAALDATKPGARLTVLAEQERTYGGVPTFYLDTAEWFRLKGDAAIAEQLTLSALDLATSDDETRQIVAFRLERDRSYGRAVELAEHLAAANAEFRPQPGRDLALALAARGRANGAQGRADLERAFQLLVDAALNPASGDFDGIEVIALMEANALIPLIDKLGGRWSLDGRLVGLTDVAARIVMEWTADDADIDLWVTEPNGERVMYSNKLSSAGGQISNDMTDGYGPEEYAIRRAPPGAYAVRINGYDADRLNPNGPGHVLIRLQRNFARPDEEATLVDVDLSYQQGRNRNDEENTKPVATLRVGASAARSGP